MQTRDEALFVDTLPPLSYPAQTRSAMETLFKRDPNGPDSPERLKRILGRDANRKAQEAIGMVAWRMGSLIYRSPFEEVDKREVKCFLFAMATLVIKSFPEELHEKLKNVAAEHRRSITKEAICLLEKALSNQEQEGVKSYWANRKLLPEFEKSIQAGAFGSGTDSTHLISEEREER